MVTPHPPTGYPDWASYINALEASAASYPAHAIMTSCPACGHHGCVAPRHAHAVCARCMRIYRVTECTIARAASRHPAARAVR